MAPRWAFFLDCLLYGKYGRTAGLQSAETPEHLIEKLSLACNLVRRATFAGTDHDKQFHDGIVDPGAPRLNNEHILLANAGQDAHTRLTLFVKERLAWEERRGTKARAAGEQAHIGELRQLCVRRLHSQILTYLPSQCRARIAGKDESVAHCDEKQTNLRSLQIAHEVEVGGASAKKGR